MTRPRVPGEAEERSAVTIPTIDFITGLDRACYYLQAKIIDTIFFEKGNRRVGPKRSDVSV